jgi:hypothetical protein
MNDTFELRLRAAVRAGWWTVLIWVVFLTVAWGIGLAVMRCQPTWALDMMGSGQITWAQIQTLYLWIISVAKVVVWIWTMGVVFLTIWLRQLRRAE